MKIKFVIFFLMCLSLFLPKLKANEPDAKSFWYNKGKSYCNYNEASSDHEYEGQTCSTSCDKLSCIPAFMGDCKTEEPYSCPSKPTPKK